MDSFLYALVVPILAVGLDLWLGDPHTFPHPVRFIGNGLDLYEKVVRKMGVNLRFAGWLALAFSSIGTWGLVGLLTSIPIFGFFVAVYFGYAGLALGCLLKECRQVRLLIDGGKIAEARHSLSMLVSRETSELSENELRRTLAETVSENLNDGFVAPMFYLTLFGPGGMWAYKSVSTMDSMWGYKTEEYGELGYAGAKCDDVLAFIPARLTAWTMILVGKINGFDQAGARQNLSTDARKMESPNAGWPMAAAAWLVGGQMGGPTVYFGEVKEKPVLGPEGKSWSSEMIDRLILLCEKTGYWSAGACIGGTMVLRWAMH